MKYLTTFIILSSLLLLLPKALAESEGASYVKDHFDREGYVILEKFFPEGVLDEWAESSQTYFQSVFEDLHANGHTEFSVESRKLSTGTREYAMNLGKHNGFQEVVMRSKGRYDMSLLQETIDEHLPSLDPIMEQLSTIIPALLQSKMSKLNVKMALVTSTPDAVEQSWHSDGEHLDMDEHMPCHCLNVFIPLVDVTREMGPTELFAESHLATRKPAPMTFGRADLKMPPLSPELKMGDILIFDYRVLHRGLPNVSMENRPVLVAVLSKPWYQDEHNYPTRSLKTCADQEGGTGDSNT